MTPSKYVKSNRNLFLPSSWSKYPRNGDVLSNDFFLEYLNIQDAREEFSFEMSVFKNLPGVLQQNTWILNSIAVRTSKLKITLSKPTSIFHVICCSLTVMNVTVRVIYFEHASVISVGACGGVVVKVLRYKPAGRGFDSRWWHNPSGRTMALGSTEPLTEMGIRCISWE